MRIHSCFLALAAACAPTVDSRIDRYHEQRPSPDRLVDGEGNYIGGWWADFEGRINPEDASGPKGQLQGWIHWSLETERYLVVANLADLNKASNTALLVVDKQDETFENVSLKYTFGDNQIQRDKASSDIENPADGSWAQVNADGDLLFAVYADKLSLEGVAHAAPADPFVQTTRSIDGFGWLQWYENMEVDEATLTIDGQEVPIPAGSLGVMDRMVGHRMHVQSWNWLSLVGEATDRDDGSTALVSLQIAKDQEAARPAIDALKYAVWVDGALVKLPDVNFVYQYTNEAEKQTGDWQISTADRSGDWVDLTFRPRFHRRDEASWLWFLYTDFNQHYGEVSGTVVVGGRSLQVEALFAVAEDSLLKL